MQSNIINTQYKTWIQSLKQNFQNAQIQAHIKVNGTLFAFYWQLGNEIIQKCKDINEALFYVKNTLEHGISRVVLVHQIITQRLSVVFAHY